MARPRKPWVRWLTRVFGHRLEAAAVYAAYALFRTLPLDAASGLGGWIGRTVGPWLRGSRTARRNLDRAFPDTTADERAAILRGMWDNLGRVIAEYPHLDRIAAERIEVVGGEHADGLRDDGKGGLFVGAHLANWEVQSVAARRRGLDLALVYRAPNNPYVDTLVTRLRTPASTRHIPKGPEGARTLLKVLSGGGHVGLLIDQKMNDGMPVPFFGRDAMTAPAVAQLALRYRLPVVPVRTERLGGARFRVTALPPVALPDTGDRPADIRAAMVQLNALVESWVRERPEQWLWLHRRWPD